VLTYEHGRIELQVGAPLLPTATTYFTVQLDAHVVERRGPSGTALENQIASFVQTLRTRQLRTGRGEDALRDVQLGEAIYHAREAPNGRGRMALETADRP